MRVKGLRDHLEASREADAPHTLGASWSLSSVQIVPIVEAVEIIKTVILSSKLGTWNLELESSVLCPLSSVVWILHLAS